MASPRRLTIACWALAMAAQAPAQAAGPAPEAPGTVQALSVMLEAERTQLEEDQKRYEQSTLRRTEALARLSRVHQALDAAARPTDTAAGDRLGELIDELRAADADRSAEVAAQVAVAERIADRLRRIGLLEKALNELEGRREEQVVGALAGTWDLVLMPFEQRGSAVLHQSGAVVNGTYQLEGGWTGSLQGTLVNRKVLLVRIDSKLGKVMEFQGTLSADGQRIRGSWLNYELAGSEGSTGHWSADRRQPTKP